MSEIAAAPEVVRPASGIAALWRHTRYVLGENPVTAFAAGLFLLIVIAAAFGPFIVPYDPYASNTAMALKPPSAAHWFGTDQIGRDVFSRVIVATQLDFFIAVASVALVFLMGGLAGVAAGFFGGWTDRIVGRIADTIMAFPLFVLAMGIVAALGNTVENIILATAIVNFPLYARIARAEANVRREAGFVMAARLSGNGDGRIVLTQVLPNIMPIMVVQMSLTMGYAILNAAGLSFIGLGVRPPTAEWGIMVAEGADLHGLRRMVDRLLPRRRADGGGVLLQSPGRRPARHRRPAAADLIMTALPLLDVRDLTVEFSTRRGIVQAVEHVDISVAKGETRGDRRRVRFRKIGHVVRGDADPRPCRAHRRRLDRLHRPRPPRRQRSRDAQPARPRNVDDLPEPARRAQPDPQGRRARSRTC